MTTLEKNTSTSQQTRWTAKHNVITHAQNIMYRIMLNTNSNFEQTIFTFHKQLITCANLFANLCIVFYWCIRFKKQSFDEQPENIHLALKLLRSKYIMLLVYVSTPAF